MQYSVLGAMIIVKTVHAVQYIRGPGWFVSPWAQITLVSETSFDHLHFEHQRNILFCVRYSLAFTDVWNWVLFFSTWYSITNIRKWKKCIKKKVMWKFRKLTESKIRGSVHTRNFRRMIIKIKCLWVWKIYKSNIPACSLQILSNGGIIFSFGLKICFCLNSFTNVGKNIGKQNSFWVRGEGGEGGVGSLVSRYKLLFWIGSLHPLSEQYSYRIRITFILWRVKGS